VLYDFKFTGGYIADFSFRSMLEDYLIACYSFNHEDLFYMYMYSMDDQCLAIMVDDPGRSSYIS
jgi:hypothetical protein